MRDKIVELYKDFLSPKQGVVMFMYDVFIIVGLLGVVIGFSLGYQGWYLLALALAPVIWFVSAVILIAMGFLLLAVVMIPTGWIATWCLSRGKYGLADKLDNMLEILEDGSRTLFGKL